MSWCFMCILNVFILLKNYIDMMKIIFQTKTEKNVSLNFFKKDKFCSGFFALQNT